MKEKDVIYFLFLDEDDAELELQEPVVSEEKSSIPVHRRADVNVELIPQWRLLGMAILKKVGLLKLNFSPSCL